MRRIRSDDPSLTPRLREAIRKADAAGHAPVRHISVSQARRLVLQAGEIAEQRRAVYATNEARAIVLEPPDLPPAWGQMLPRTIRIELAPVPDELSPNWRGNKWNKFRATKRYRRSVGLRAWAACAGNPPKWARAVMETRVYYTSNRDRDEDNLIASLKAARDGLQDAGVVLNDSGITNARPVIVVDRNKPRVELAIRELDADGD